VSSGIGLNVATNGDVLLDSMIATNNSTGVQIVNTTGSDATVKVLNTYSGNVFSDNSQYGLLIASNGYVSLTGITANNNGLDGIKVTTAGDLLLRNAVCYRNAGSGLNAAADGGATLSSVKAANNGLTANGDGLYIEVADGSQISIAYSVVTGNYGSGIEVSGDATPTLTKTSYYGNDINGSGDANLKID
jgi:hypothetical protein